MRGKLICFEGIDGSGKETQIKLILKFLKGRKVSVHKYPDAKSPFGRIIDAFLKRRIELSAFSQFSLYVMDIAKDQERIGKELKEGRVVILDRYVFSTVAYQCSKGIPLGEGEEIIESMNFIKPDLVILLDVSPEVSMRRKGRQKKMDRHEADRKLLGRVRANYLSLLRKKFLAKRWVKVDAGQKPKEVFEVVKGFIAPLLKE